MSEQTYTREQIEANRATWVAALRSGEYEQARHKLGNPVDGYCCLGVASEIAKRAGVIDGFDGGAATAPREVQEWLGLCDPDGAVDMTEWDVFGDDAEDPDETFYTSLIDLNDAYGKTFEQIADAIDGYLPIGVTE